MNKMNSQIHKQERYQSLKVFRASVALSSGISYFTFFGSDNVKQRWKRTSHPLTTHSL